MTPQQQRLHTALKQPIGVNDAARRDEILQAYDAMMGAFVAVALSDDKFDALNAQDAEDRAAIDDEEAYSRGY